MTVAVTGATGFLGSRLAVGLHADGVDVRALVRAPAQWLLPVEQVSVDLLDATEKVAEALAGTDVVVHLAGHNEVVAAEDPDRALAETLLMGRHVAAAAELAGVRRIVYVSTVHVYGARLAEGEVVDERAVPEPRSAYAIARLAVEHLVAATSDPVVLRLTNAIGAPVDPAVDRWTLVAADLCRTAAATGEVVLRSPGLQWRDFIPLADVIRILGAATDADRVPAGTYNLSSGAPMTIRALAELVRDRIEALTSVRPPLVAPPADGIAPQPYRVDPARLAALGLTAAQDPAEAIDELVAMCFADSSIGAHP